MLKLNKKAGAYNILGFVFDHIIISNLVNILTNNIE